MANGYIGKISAVVTANTSDLSRKLQGGIAVVDKFANRLSRSVTAANNAAAASFDKIFTPLQRLERSLQGALKLNLRPEAEVNKLRALVSVAEDINKPLEAAAKNFTGLSRTVAAEFQPALVRAQGQVQFIEKQFEVFGRISESTFNRVTRNVEKTTVAINQLREASALVRGLPTGNELAFSDPRLSANLQAAQKAGRQALSLPASTIAGDPQIEGLTRQIARVSELSVAAAAKVKAAVAPNELAAARQESDRLNSVLESLVAKLNKKYAVVIDAQRAIADSTALSARLDELQENATFSITGTPQNLKQVEAELVRILGQFDKLTEAQRQPLGEQFGKVMESLRAGNLPEAIQNFQALEASVKLAANETERLARANKQLTIAPDQPPPPSPSTPLGNRLAQQGAERIRGLTGNLNIDSTPVSGVFNEQAQRDIDALASRVGQVRQQLESLPNSVRTQFVPALQQAAAQLTALQNSPAATAEQIERAAASVRRLEDGAKRAATAMALPSFSEFSENFSTKQAIGELQALQQVLARVGAVAGGPAARAYEAYRAKLQEAVTAGTTGLPRVRAEIERLQVAAAKAAASTGKISFNSAFRAIQRGGDIARGSFGNLNLAVQQGIFAIDDFASVTGGLDQRIRAAANNVSQLAFLLGGTYGLAAGVAISVTAQLAVGISKWAFGAEEAEKRQKQLEAAIKQVNSALERQLQVTESLASAYKGVADAAASAGSSPRGQQQRGRRQQFEDIRSQQQERRREVAASVNPLISGNRARIAAIDEQLQTETNGGARIRLQRERERLQRRLEEGFALVERDAQAEIDAATRRAGPENARRSLERRRDRTNAQLEGALRTRDELVARGAPTTLTDNQIESLSRLLSRLEVAILKIGDEAAIALAGQAQAIGDQLGRAQANVGDVRGFSNIEAFANAASQQLEQTFDRLADGDITSEAASAAVERLRGLAAALEQASIATGEFYKALDGAAGNLARQVEQELQSRGESVRRQANAAEAQFGGDSQQAAILRNAQGRVESARQDAQSGRQAIDRQIEARRSALERELLAGRGNAEAVDLARRARFAEQRAADESLSPDDRTSAQLLASTLRDQLLNLFNQDAGIQGLRDRADQVDVQAQREQQQIEQAIRGRELSLTPGQRAGEALTSDIDAIRQFYGQLAEATTGLVDFGAQNAAIGRLFEQTARGVAPAIFALQDAVANAVLQGPSRAALEATDVSTVEGARELNRLLRGDDGARNQDLVELQKQSAALEELVDLARQQGVPGVAN